ncbi:hypothetical protein T484DRAFT_1955830 [Baffinella frigidus]|nr:hypothetical protein T484DRAFT_1955830 [Cryptophyta sp. CCMP2293]
MQCPREASCGAPGAAIKTARHCAWHKGPNESDLRHLRCRHAEGCERRAQYGEMPHASEKPMPVFCGAHRLPHHRDVKHRMCAEIDCHKRALFGSNSTGMRFCAKHKDDDDINLSRLPGLRAGSKPRRARSRSSGASVLSADA